MPRVKAILCDMGSNWSAYPEDIVELVRKRGETGEATCQFEMQFEGSHIVQKYLVNIAQQTQFNESTGKVRSLKFVLEGERFDANKVQTVKGTLVRRSSYTRTALVTSPKMAKPVPSRAKKADNVKAQPAENDILLRLAVNEEERRKKEELELQQRRANELLVSEKPNQPLHGDVDFVMAFNSVHASDAIRLALIHSDVAFAEEFTARCHYRGVAMHGVLCVLKNGTVIRSREAALRHIGMSHGLYPRLPRSQAMVDEMLEDCQDVSAQLAKGSKTDMLELVAAFMVKPERLLKANVGYYSKSSGIVPRRSIADFELVATTKLLFTHNIVDEKHMWAAFPQVMRLVHHITNDAKVIRYQELRQREKQAAKLRRVEKRLDQLPLKSKADEW